MIKISKLSYRYNRKKVLFNNLDLQLFPGKTYGLLGKNGAGKSSLIKNIAGLLIPTHGSCKVFGEESRERKAGFMEELFFIPEETELPRLSLRLFQKIYAPFYPKFSEDSFHENLQTFNISKDVHLQQLSFGQKKKVYIAFALAANTKLLIMDEPTNGLDIPSKVQFRQMVAATGRSEKITIMSTHQVRDLDDLIDAVLIMDGSEMLLQADKSILLQKLFFSNSPKDDSAEALYSEITALGKSSIYRNTGSRESYLDMETLFNATLTLREKFTSTIFS